MEQRYMKVVLPGRLASRPVVSETRQDRGVTWLSTFLAAVMILFLIVPFIALLWRTITLDGYVSADLSIFTAVTLSLGTTAVSALLIVLFGTPLAYILARQHFPLKRVVTLFVEIPIVMPPVVAGLALLTAFGRRGLLGSFLTAANVTIAFTWLAVVLAQTFVAAPFYIRAAQTRFAALPRDLEEAARIDGADGWRVFWYVIRPLSSRALAAGLVLSWARALGEFGATILFAGNLQGRTQTMPLLIYGALERDLNATYVSALILLGMALLALALTRHLTRLDEKDGDPLAER